MLHWPTTIDDALGIQQDLRARVIRADQHGELRTVAGVDAGYHPDPAGVAAHGIARAVVVVLDMTTLEPLDYVIAERPAPLPYIPGFLSFREGPAVLAAIEALHIRPDLLICDGQGIAHPRRLGIASHIGVLADLPAIGCAKSLLIGRHQALAEERGAWVPLTDGGEVIGAALRTRPGARPVYISIGHRVSLASAIRLVMACTTRYRLPETTRAADGLASHGRVPKLRGNAGV